MPKVAALVLFIIGFSIGFILNVSFEFYGNLPVNFGKGRSSLSAWRSEELIHLNTSANDSPLISINNTEVVNFFDAHHHQGKTYILNLKFSCRVIAVVS